MSNIRNLLRAYDALLCDVETAKSSKQRVDAYNAANALSEELSWVVVAAISDALSKHQILDDELIRLYPDVYCGDYLDYLETDDFDISDLCIADIIPVEGGTIYCDVDSASLRQKYPDDEADIYDLNVGEYDMSEDYDRLMIYIPPTNSHKPTLRESDDVYYDRVHDITWEDYWAALEYYASVA